MLQTVAGDQHNRRHGRRSQDVARRFVGHVMFGRCKACLLSFPVPHRMTAAPTDARPTSEFYLANAFSCVHLQGEIVSCG